MKIYRPDYMKTPRQGSVSIPLPSAARPCVVPHRRPVWAATSIPLAATRRALWPSQRVTGLWGHCTAGQLPIAEYFMEFGVCSWVADSLQIVLFGVACGVGTGAVS